MTSTLTMVRWTPSLVKLNELLASLYPADAILTLVNFAQISPGLINFSNKTLIAFHSVLNEAVKQKKLTNLCEVVTNQYPEQVLVTEYYEAYQSEIQGAAPSPSQSVIYGFGALVELLMLPEVRRTLRRYQEDLQTTSDQIEDIKNYKDLHDLLHDLQETYYDPVSQIVVRAELDFEAWTDVAVHQITFDGIVASIKDISLRETYEQREIDWTLDYLKLGGDLLHEAITERDQNKLVKSQYHINRLLDRQPPQINTKLNDISKKLRLSRLITALAIVRNRILEIKDTDIQAVSSFISGLESLDDLNKSLLKLVEVHDIWQFIDRDLRQIEPHVKQDVEDLKVSWPRLKKDSQKLYSENTEDWAIQFANHTQQLDTALQGNETKAITDAFRLYRRLTKVQFLRVDKKLKSHCAELQKIGSEPLEAVNHALDTLGENGDGRQQDY